MKTIGLLGGMSWESSIEYERMINEGVRARLGGTHSADLVIRSYDFAMVEALQEAGDWDAAGTLLARDARRLQDAGGEESCCAPTRCTSWRAAGVIAGCTEIELLVGPDDVDVAYFPTTRLHAEAAVVAALAERPS